MNVDNGDEIASCVYDYPEGESGIYLDPEIGPENSHLARQHLRD